MAAIEHVRAYLEREWWVIPLRPRSKEPIQTAWSTSRPSSAEVIRIFLETLPEPNIGMVMGDMKADVDLDCQQAIQLAAEFLPRTEAIWGHREKPRSHWLYLLESPLDPDQRKVRKDPSTGRGLIETRTNDNQSMMPGSIHPNGYPVEWMGRPGNWEPATIDPEVLAQAVNRLHAATLLAIHWGDPGTGRHQRALALAGGLQRLGWSLDEALEFIQPVLRVAEDNEVEDRLRTVRDTYENAAIRETTGWRTLIELLPHGVALEVRRRLGGADEAIVDLTDTGNALRLAKWYGADIRFCPQMRRWFVWDGRRWEKDVPGANRVMHLAQLTTDRMLTEELSRVGDDQRKAFLKHVTASRNIGKTKAMVEQAEYLPELQIHHDELDANPKLLNCRNGTLNLDTVALQRHDRADYLTLLADCNYIPNAGHTTWDQFLASCTNGDRERQRFLQICCGYSIQGHNPDDRFFMLFGPSQTGKSTFIGALEDALGEYARSTDPSTFATLKSDGGSAREDLVRLRGARIVVTGEVEEGSRWAVAVLKRVTGGDSIVAREMYSPSIEFKAGFKLWVGTNIKPRVRDSSGGFWRRVVLVPFTHQVPMENRDNSLRRQLSDSSVRSAILSWALAGYRLWQEQGLAALPEDIEAEVDAYRQESDVLGDFVAELCVEREDARVPSSRLYGAYVGWARNQGSMPISQGAFKLSMSARGYPAVRSSSGIQFHGLELRLQAERLYASLAGAGAGGEVDPFAPRVN